MKKSGETKHQSAAKPGWRYADHGEGMLVDAHDSSDDAAIVLKARVPIGVSQNDIGRAAGPVFVGLGVEPAQIRLQIERRKVVPCRRKGVGGFGIVARIQNQAEVHVECGQILEALVAIAQINIAGVGLERGIGAVLRAIEILGVGDIDGVEQERVHHAEDDGVGGDSQRERDDRGEGEATGLAENAQRQPQHPEVASA